MIYQWDDDKNALLKKTRGISFEQVVMHIPYQTLMASVLHRFVAGRLKEA